MVSSIPVYDCPIFPFPFDSHRCAWRTGTAAVKSYENKKPQMKTQEPRKYNTARQSRHVPIPVLAAGRAPELPNGPPALEVGRRLLRDLDADRLDDAHGPGLGGAAAAADGLADRLDLEAVPRGALEHELGARAVSPAQLGRPRGPRQDRDGVVVLSGARCCAEGLADGPNSAGEECGDGHDVGGNDVEALLHTILILSTCLPLVALDPLTLQL